MIRIAVIIPYYNEKAEIEKDKLQEASEALYPMLITQGAVADLTNWRLWRCLH